jgi:hypothetical protein
MSEKYYRPGASKTSDWEIFTRQRNGHYTCKTTDVVDLPKTLRTTDFSKNAGATFIISYEKLCCFFPEKINRHYANICEVESTGNSESKAIIKADGGSKEYTIEIIDKPQTTHRQGTPASRVITPDDRRETIDGYEAQVPRLPHA